MLDVIVAGLTLLISFLLTPIIRKAAIRKHIFAVSNNRTIHREKVPNLGGLSIFLAFVLGFGIYHIFTESAANFISLLIGGGIVVLVGLWDDIRNLGCYQKLLGQIIAAVIAVSGGFSVATADAPFVNIWNGEYAGILFSVMWIVTITNAMNLLDGLDGLAAGMSILIAIFIAIAAAAFGEPDIFVLSLFLIAAIVGFVKYNLPPAKIFMGDTGSLFLGFALACLSLKAISSPASGLQLPALFVLFGIPLADTALAILRRFMQGKHLFHADKEHIHHRFIEKGFSQRHVLAVIFMVTVMCGLFSLALINAYFHQKLWLLFVWSCLVFWFLYYVGCFDFFRSKQRPFPMDQHVEIVDGQAVNSKLKTYRDQEQIDTPV